MPRPTIEPVDDTVRSPRRRRLMWALVIVGLAASTVMWIYAAMTPWLDRGKPVPGQLSDEALAQAAEPVCARAVEQIAALPGAADATSPQDRAVSLAQANSVLEEMVADLRALEASTVVAADTDAVAEWFSDWDRYLADRQRHAAALARGTDEPFRVDALSGQPVDRPMEWFATVNRMPSCAPPGDV